MAKAKAIDKRRKSVQNTRKITRTMEMISTAAFKKAGRRAMSFRPYANSIYRLVGNVGRAAGDVSHPLLKAPNDNAPEAVLLIASNRGLCASYNSHVINLTQKRIKELGPENVQLYLSGKKAITFYRKGEAPVAANYTHVNYIPAWSDIEEIASMFLSLYEKQEIRGLSVVYTHFKSAGTQIPIRETLLPISQSGTDESEDQSTPQADYIFHPEPAEILSELIPLSFKVKLFSCFLDAGTSEQIARMRAMHSATDAANKMIKSLTQKYNRARQSQITMELLDIIGGSQVVN